MPITVLLGCECRDTSRSIARHLAEVPRTSREAGFACREAPPGRVLSQVASLRPDVLITEQAPAASGLSTAAQVRQLSEATRVLLLCDVPTLEAVIEAVRQGACGFIAATEGPALLARAVRTVHAGSAWFGRGVLHEALQSLLCPPSNGAPREPVKLTPREEQILELIGAGLSNKEIGRRLAISDHTVKTHLHRIYVKLNRSGRYKAFLLQAQAVPDFAPTDLGWATLEKLTSVAA